MPNPLKLASLWRVIKDLDLEGPRAAARARFTLAIVSEADDDASRLRQLLTGPDAPPHPWIEIAALGTPAPGTARGTSAPGTSAHAAKRHRRALGAVGGARWPASSSRATRTCPTRSSWPAIASRPPALRSSPSWSATRRARRRCCDRASSSRVAVDALDEAAIDAIATALVLMLPEDQQVALGAHFPPLRPVIFTRIIERTARANASFALTTGLAETIPVLTAPLNLGDMVVLTKNQLMMCYRLALAAGRDEEPKAMMTEIIGVLGSGVLFRQAARQLVGLIPIAGLLPKVAISYAGTYAIGKAMVAWTTEGKQVTVDTMASYSRDGLVKGRALAEHLVESAGATGGRIGGRFERLRQLLPGKRTEGVARN